MADTKLGGLFVEVFAKGFASVQASINGVKAAVASAVASVSNLNNAITQAGNVAGSAFNSGKSAISGFIRTADPAGILKLQGVLGQIGVQLGSIFLPILDKVQGALEGVLGWLRTLSDEQKDQISKWVEMAGVIALSVAILPKIIGFIQSGAVAFKVLGAAIGIATGGIVPLIGLIAGLAVGFSLFESAAEDGVGVLDTLKSAIVPLIENFKSFGKEILSALAPIAEAFVSIIPTLIDLGNVFLSALTPVIALVKEVAAVLASVLSNAITKIVPTISSCLKIVVDLFSQLVTLITPLLEPLGELINTVVNVIAKAFGALAPILKAASDLIVQAVEVIIPIFLQIVETVNQLVEAAEPIITAFCNGVAIAFKVLAAIIGGIIAGLQPVWEGLSEVVQTVGDVFSAVFDMIADTLSGFGISLGEADGICTTIFDSIKSAVLLLKPVFVAVFDAIKLAVLSLGKVLVYIGSLMKSIATGNFRGAFARAREATEELEERFKKRGEKREEDKQKKKDAKEEEDAWKEFDSPAATAAKGAPGRHGGRGVPKTELVGIAEMWRKAQTASVESPEMRINQERLNTQKAANTKLDEHTKELKEINKKTKDSPAVLG